MDDLLDMIASDESASKISDKIKEILFSKSSERIDAFRPLISNSMFGEEEIESEVGSEVEEDDESEE